MPITKKEKFIEKVIRIIDRWSFEKCAHCENGTLISIDGMLDFKCSNCGKSMNPSEYLGEIAKIVFDYRETRKNLRSMKEIDK